jgi:glutamate-5-semialdehyde dehydrogenase
MNIEEIVKYANQAKIELMGLGADKKNEALKNVAQNIEANKEKIYEANKKDLEYAAALVEEGKLTKATFGRLKLDENKMRDMIQGIYDVIKLEDPANKILWTRELDEGLILKKVTTPIGVLGIIFEARPDVIAQISSLAIKSGNAVILKGGSEANNTNSAIFEIIKEALDKTEGFPKYAVNLVYSHDDIKKMLDMDGYIDLIIPRGSNKLVKFIQENTKIPVLGHASGICHIFVDKSADFDMAEKICIDAKTQYPTACNAVETILVHKDFPYYEELKNALNDKGIEVIENPKQFGVEYSDTILNIKKVDSLDEAINHINKYGSHHTDSIITSDLKAAEIFMNNIDSAGVFTNTSTRFSDGFRFGFGAEVGISTNKTHARGPVGLDGLCIYKYKLTGTGQIVDDYAKGIKTFKHKDI